MGVLKERKIKEGIPRKPRRKFKRKVNLLKNVKFKPIFRTADKY